MEENKEILETEFVGEETEEKEVKKSLKDQIKDGYLKAKEWTKNKAKYLWDHKEQVAAICAAVSPLVIKAGKSYANYKDKKESKWREDHMFYERHTMHYYEVRRQPDNWELMEIDRRCAPIERGGKGEHPAKVLRDLGLSR